MPVNVTGPGDETEDGGNEDSGDGAGVADKGLGSGECGFGEPDPYRSASASDSAGNTSLRASSTAAAEDIVVA